MRTFGPPPMTTLAAQREQLAQSVEEKHGPFDPRLLEAIRHVPRERFVRPEDVERSAEDVPLPLDDDGWATVSAPHAYLLSYRLLALGPDDSLLELGTGTGYGAALASYVVGPGGRVTTIEIDGLLASRARALLLDLPNVTPFHGDAIDGTALWRLGRKIVCTFAVDELPRAWLEALPDGGALVAPVGARAEDQQLVRVVRDGSSFHTTRHGGVRYVRNRSTSRWLGRA